MIGLGTDGYQTDQFDNLSVTPVGSATPTGPIVAGDDTAECVDANGGSRTPGTKVQMWDCDSNPSSQGWTMDGNGTVGINGQCLDVTGASTPTAPSSKSGPATAAGTSSGSLSTGN